MLHIPEGKRWYWKNSPEFFGVLSAADVHTSAGPSSASGQGSSTIENRSLVSPPLQHEWESKSLITDRVPITAEESFFPFLRNVFSGSFEFIESAWICSLPSSVTGSPQFFASFHLVHKFSFSFHFHYKSETNPLCSKVWRLLYKPGNNFQQV